MRKMAQTVAIGFVLWVSGIRASASVTIGEPPSDFGIFVYSTDATETVVNVPVNFAVHDSTLYILQPDVRIEVFVARRDWNSNRLVETNSLGLVANPPNDEGYLLGQGTSYFGWTWKPTRAGDYVLWARLTYSVHYVDSTTTPPVTNNFVSVVDSSETAFHVHPVNDDLGRATELPRQIWATNSTFTLEGATAESNEPLVFGKIPAQHSVWWKWKPSRSYNVRWSALQVIMDCQSKSSPRTRKA